ncbi:MAG: ABC transporter ATP-binding protein [Rhizobium sp.]
MMTIDLEAVGIVKRYGSLLANDRIDLAVEKGEIHAVMGENGAGKSTLMSILYGLQQPDAGRILLHGREVRFKSPVEAIRSGMGMVHQAFKLFNSLTVWENIVYGDEPRRGLTVDGRTARLRIRELAERYRLAVDPAAVISHLSVGVRQRVEILKALYRDARILILDEPTAVLTPHERDALFAVMRSIVADGRTVLFVTHKLNEVMAVTNRITVLRDGHVATRLVTAETTAREIVQAMIGRNVNLRVDKTQARPERVLLEVNGLTVPSGGVKPLVDHASFSVRAGEIVGIAGVAGNGQSELVEAIVGLRRAESGRVLIDGRDATLLSVMERREVGLAYIPEDRAATGAALAASASDNLAMGFQRHPLFRRGRRLVQARIREQARALIREFDIRVPDETTSVGALSGGNLQKVVVARELTHSAPVLIAEQPTRGIDVGAIEFIHQRLIAERNRGHAVLLVSAELSEIMALSDRILVIYEGQLMADIPAAEASEERLGDLLAGNLEAAA